MPASRPTPSGRRRRLGTGVGLAVAALGVATLPGAPAASAADPAAPTPTSGVPVASAGASPGGGVSATADPTRTRRARASRAHRRTIPLAVWAASPYARMVSGRESGGSCTVVNWAGPYRGKWQMTDQLWRAFGGLQYARHPERAACEEQDAVAYRIWVAVGWSPWGG